MDAQPRRVTFPVRAIDADEIERVREPARDQPALTAGDPGDENRLARLRAAARMEPRLGRSGGPLGDRRGLAEVEQALRRVVGKPSHPRLRLCPAHPQGSTTIAG
jgi:hypothetical protein